MSSQETLLHQGRMNMKNTTPKNRVIISKHRRAKLISNNETPEICPQCGAETVTDMDKAEIYCPDCGLVVKASIPYVGNKQIIYPFGTLL